MSPEREEVSAVKPVNVPLPAVVLVEFNSFLHRRFDEERIIDAAEPLDLGDRLIEDLKDPYGTNYKGVNV